MADAYIVNVVKRLTGEERKFPALYPRRGKGAGRAKKRSAAIRKTAYENEEPVHTVREPTPTEKELLFGRRCFIMDRLTNANGGMKMLFEKIDRNNWKRNAYFEHYFANVPCTYSMTVKIDITPIKKKRMKVYPAMLYYITTLVNRHSEFRTAINQAGELGIYDEMIPSYTIFHEDTETFSDLWTPYMPDFEAFAAAYERDKQQYGNRHGMIGKPNAPENIFTVSMIPWATFEGFNLNLQKGYDYLIPIFTIGKYGQADGRTILPLAIQVHHAVCDGFHICRFVNELQELING